MKLFKKYQPAIESAKEKALMGGNKQPHFLAIASGKGGVGKSTVTVNLAVSLNEIRKKSRNYRCGYLWI